MLPAVQYLKMFIGLLAIVNPLLAVPLFVTLTEGDEVGRRRATARRAALAVTVVILITALLGDDILAFFGISLASFQVGAGILLLMMAIAMMHARTSGARHTEHEDAEAQERGNIAVVPLAIPLLAGPGAMSTVIIYAHRSTHWEHVGLLMVEGVVIGVLVWLTLLTAEPISRLIGTTGINIFTRIMGLILAAISIEFITQGLVHLLPGLA